MEKEKILYLIDGTAYIHRAFHAIRELTNSNGKPTNAVFGFTRMIQKLIQDKSPEYLVMLFDAKGKTFRHELYSEYKANRPPMSEDMAVQIPDIMAVTKGYNIPVIEMSGYEADDLIGTLAKKAETAGFSVVMVTGDKDFMQLVSDNITIYDPMKDQTIDGEKIRKEMGLEPIQIIDMMGLAGDSADNIPGVPGIGKKTATTLIQTYGDMDRIYAQIESITKKKQKENLVRYREQAFMSRRLVVIDTRVPISFEPEQFRHREPNYTELSRLFKELEFRQLQQSLPRQSDLSGKAYHTILSEADLNNLIRQVQSLKVAAVDTETTAIDPLKARLVGLSIAIKPHEGFYIPCAHDYSGAPEQLNREYVLSRLKPILENPDIKKIGQNIKYDLIVLYHHGIDLQGIWFDTMLASYLLNPAKRAHNLNQIALDFLDHKMITYDEVTSQPERKAGFQKVPLDEATQYACEDADITLMACGVLEPKLKEGHLFDLFERVEMPLVPVLAKMEMTGIRVNRKNLLELSGSFQHQLEAIEEDIYGLAGEKFNIKSSQQLGKILFEKLNLPVQKKTQKKTGYSTDVGVLTTLAAHHELPALILRHRTLAKLKSTYTDALLELVTKETDRIHTSFNQTVTATGRLSSSDPNLQNIPIRTDEGRLIRRAFIPRDGWVLLSADYSQIELRILAHCSNDPILISAFKDDEDIHLRTAAEVFQMDAQHISAELRRQAKAINFGIIYGMSPFGLSRQLGISQQMAKTYIDNYFERYEGVKRYMDQAIEEARHTQGTSTLLGRFRPLPDINSKNRNIRLFAERTAINTPIQGTAADLIKLAMIRVDSEIERKGFSARMLLSVHDELVFEVPPSELEDVKRSVKQTMEAIWDLQVPLKVNLSWGEHWDEAH